MLFNVSRSGLMPTMKLILLLFLFLQGYHAFVPVAPRVHRVGQPIAWVSAQTTTRMAKKGFSESIKSYFAPVDDGLTFRERLGKLGLAAVLSYGWVSNMSYCVSVSLAWFLFSKQTGKSPLAPGQWKGFLAVYAGFWVFNNIVRPLRLAMAVGISPKFDAIVKNIQQKFNVGKPLAVTITVVLANVVGTISFMCLGIFLASIFAGVPVWAK